MLTTLSKILSAIPNCNIKVDVISYETSELGFAQLEGHVVDINGVEIFPIVLPVGIQSVPSLIESIHDTNKVPPSQNLRKLRVPNAEQSKK